MNKNKHLTLADRSTIEELLGQKKRFSDIARFLGKDPTTISKEIRNRFQLIRNGKYGKNYNNCQNQLNCKRSAICISCNSPRRHSLCRHCPVCNKHCNEYLPQVCERHTRPPYVCNGCGKRYDCNFEKHVYVASKAHEDYLNTLSQARSGITLTEEELESLNRMVSPLIKQNQSPHHVCATNRDSILVSERTLYRLLDANLISARNIDLPRKVRFKPRKKKKLFKVDKACRIDRDYDCFKKHNKAPYDVFRFLYGSELLEMLGCTTIPAQQVTLNKTAFKKEEVSK